MTTDSEAAVKVLMKQDSEFLASFGINLVEVVSGLVTLQMDVRSSMVNSQGFCHGGVLFTLLDTAAAYASATSNQAPATIDAHVSYLAPASLGQPIVAKGQLIKRGKTINHVVAQVYDKQQQCLASYTASCVNRGQIVDQ